MCILIMPFNQKDREDYKEGQKRGWKCNMGERKVEERGEE